jgi:hypothetical protein
VWCWAWVHRLNSNRFLEVLNHIVDLAPKPLQQHTWPVVVSKRYLLLIPEAVYVCVYVCMCVGGWVGGCVCILRTMNAEAQSCTWITSLEKQPLATVAWLLLLIE